MAIKRSGFQTRATHAVAVQARPISGVELADLKHAIAAIAPAWSVELECATEATVVVLPEDGDDAVGPSFMISRETYGFRLEQLHWDVLTEVGVFPSTKDVAAAIGARLAVRAAADAPASAILH